MTVTVLNALGQSHLQVRVLLLLSLACSVTGCGRGPTLYDIPGTITVDGQPADGATLMFHPTNSGKIRWVSTANVEADGSFKIVTDTRPGIPAGQYKITLTWPDPAKKPPASAIANGSSDDPPDLLQGAYATLNNSNPTVDVTSSLKALPPIEIKRK